MMARSVRFLLCLILLAAFSRANAAVPLAVVKLVTPATVAPGDVHLADIAEIETTDVNLRTKLAGVILGPAPPGGTARRIRHDYIILRIRQQRVDPTLVRIDGPDPLEISLKAPTAAVAGANGAGERATEGVGLAGVVRGQSVTVQAVSGSVSITTKGKALEAGIIGAVVRVQVGVTGRIVTCTVIDGESVAFDI